MDDLSRLRMVALMLAILIAAVLLGLVLAVTSVALGI